MLWEGRRDVASDGEAVFCCLELRERISKIPQAYRGTGYTQFPQFVPGLDIVRLKPPGLSRMGYRFSQATRQRRTRRLRCVKSRLAITKEGTSQVAGSGIMVMV